MENFVRTRISCPPDTTPAQYRGKTFISECFSACPREINRPPSLMNNPEQKTDRCVDYGQTPGGGAD
ncbi:hypothetical protein [Nocardia sp. IFM 10818]